MSANPDNTLFATFKCPKCYEEQKFLCLSRAQEESTTETSREVLCGGLIGSRPCLTKFVLAKNYSGCWRVTHNDKAVLSDIQSLRWKAG